MNDSSEPIPLPEVAEATVVKESDSRPRIPEPLPVRLLTVEDARLNCAAGLEHELDAFYKTILKFERSDEERELIYRAENFRLCFDVLELPVERVDMRCLGVEVLYLREIEQRLIDAEIEYAVQRGLTPGKKSLLLRDPAGNWIEVTEAVRIG